MKYLINEKRRIKRRKKFGGIRFSPNFWDNPLDTPITNDGPYATLDGGEGPSESLVSTVNAHAIEVHEMLVDENFDSNIEQLQIKNGGLPVIFNAGNHVGSFPMYEKFYGNYIILKDAVHSR